jgi:hypothetical protein
MQVSAKFQNRFWKLLEHAHRVLGETARKGNAPRVRPTCGTCGGTGSIEVDSGLCPMCVQVEIHVCPGCHGGAPAV